MYIISSQSIEPYPKFSLMYNLLYISNFPGINSFIYPTIKKL